MDKHKSRRHEELQADVERWSLELAEEIGLVHHVQKNEPTVGRLLTKLGSAKHKRPR